MNSTQVFGAIAALLFLPALASAQQPDPVAAIGEMFAQAATRDYSKTYCHHAKILKPCADDYCGDQACSD